MSAGSRHIEVLAAFDPPASQDIAPSGIASGETFGTPVIGLTIAPTGIASDEAFGTPTVTTGAVDIAPTGIASAEGFGTPTVTSGLTIAPDGIASDEAFGTPTVTPGAADIAPTGIVGGEAFGTPTLTPGPVSVAPTGISSEEAFGTPTVGAPQLITVTGIPSGETFGTPAISTHAYVYPVGVPSGETFGGTTGGSGGTGLAISTRSLPGEPLVAPRDLLIDGELGYTYAWDINHTAEETLSLARSLEHSAPNGDVRVVRQQSAPGPLTLTLQSTILLQSQRDALEDFYDRCEDKVVVFHHAEGDEYDVLMTGLDIHAERGAFNPRTPSLPYIWRATIELLIVGVRTGALAEVM